MSGVRIDYWAITTFWGFTDMIDAIGGLTVDVPFPFYDLVLESRPAAGRAGARRSAGALVRARPPQHAAG